MKLQELLAKSGAKPVTCVGGDAPIKGISADSRMVQPGDLFVSMPSQSGQPMTFADLALAAGCAAIITQQEAIYLRALECGRSSSLFPPDQTAYFRSVGRIAHTLLGNPCSSLKMAAVTGTNGKTTVAWLMRSALEALDGRAGSIGTLGIHDGESMVELGNTTPFPVECAKLIAQCRDLGCRSVSMEASSHALAQERLSGTTFDVGVFTNLTQDHLDFHLTMESYGDAKLRLFTDWATDSRLAGKPFVSVLNRSDKTALSWENRIEGETLWYGDGGDLTFEVLASTASRTHLAFSFRGEKAEADLRMGGAYNIENLAAAVGGLLGLGWSLKAVCESFSSVVGVPGRFESVPNDRDIDVIVDYAHTSDALEKLLASCKKVRRGRIITVFGCGGNRDKTKRPLMAKAAAQSSDVTIITSDNPREEDPMEIIADVLKGIEPGSEHHVMVERPEAIRFAIGLAQQGDMVVLAGKGHEDYQIIGRTKHPMDDRKLAREALEMSGQ